MLIKFSKLVFKTFGINCIGFVLGLLFDPTRNSPPLEISINPAVKDYYFSSIINKRPKTLIPATSSFSTSFRNVSVVYISISESGVNLSRENSLTM